MLQEFYSVATRKAAIPLGREAARRLVEAYGSWHLVAVDLPIIREAMDLEARYQLSFRDALIVAAACACGAERLLSEDLPHGQVFRTVTVENPFAS